MDSEVQSRSLNKGINPTTAMKSKKTNKENSFNRFSIMFLTLLILTGLGSVYYFLYLNTREANLDRHYYGAMKQIQENINSNIQEHIKTTEAKSAETFIVFAGALKAIQTQDSVKNPKPYLEAAKHANDNKQQTKQNEVAQNKRSPADTNQSRRMRGEHEEEDHQPPVSVTEMAAADSVMNYNRTQQFNDHSGLKLKDFQFGKHAVGSCIVEADESEDDMEISFIKTVDHLGNHKLSSRLSARYNIAIKDLFYTFFRTDIFDEFIVLNNDKIVDATFSSELTDLKQDSLFNLNANGRDAKIPVLNVLGSSYRCYTQTFKIGNRNWKIVGLVEGKKFSFMKHSIPRNQRFTVFILLLFAILAIPFIKSFIMSRTERLQTSDVVFSVFSLVLIVSLISLLIFDNYLQWENDRNGTQARLHDFSDKVCSNFRTEINSMYAELENYPKHVDSLPYINAALKKDSAEYLERLKSIDLLKAQMGSRATDSLKRMETSAWEKMAADRRNYHPTIYPEYNFLFMVNDQGRTLYDQNDPNSQLVVNSRDYFKNMSDRKFSYLHDHSNPYVFDAVFSLRDGQLRGIVARPYDTLQFTHNKYTSRVVETVISSELQSLTNPVMPSTFGFCLINKNGRVIYHSDKQKSLNENFLNECNGDPQIQAALQGHTNSDLQVDYSLKPIQLYIRPVMGTEYFLVTFTENEHVDDMHGQVFGIAILFQLTILLIYLLIGFAISVSYNRRSDLKIPKFSFAFILPKKVNRDRYLQSTLFNALHMIILLSVSCHFQHSMLLLFIFFISPFYVVTFNYFLLSDQHFSSLINKRIDNYINGKRLGWWQNAKVLLTLATLLIFNVSAANYLDSYGLLFFYQVLVLVIYLFTEEVKNFRFLKANISHHLSYMIMVYSLVLLVCIVPVTRFAILVYDKEWEIAVKSAQLDMASSYSDRITFLDHSTNKNYTSSSIARGNYAASFYNTQTSTQLDTVKNKPAGKRPEEDVYDELHCAIRSHIQDAGTWDGKLRYCANDSLWKWFRIDNDKSQMGFQALISPIDTSKKSVAFLSDLPIFHFPGKAETWAFSFRIYMIFCILMYLLYYILNLFVRKLFTLESFKESKFDQLDVRFFKEDNPAYRIFVTGLPCSGKTNYFKELYSKKEHYVYVDLISCKDKDEWEIQKAAALKNENGIVLIDHFEYDCMNDATNMLKLILLESLAQKPNVRVVIISAIHPQGFLQLYTAPGATEQSIDGSVTAHTGDRWNKSLACFYNFWFPIQGIENARDKYLTTLQSNVPEPLRKTIEEECNHGYFLRKIGDELCLELADKPLSSSVRKIEKAQEDIVLKVQKISNAYYLSIWALLTQEEQYVLFDLAQDGLVNAKNLDIIDTLVLKGLVVYRDSLMLMNRSFRNFIISEIEPRDMMKMEQSKREAGTWDKFKKPLLIIVIALIIFVLQSDHSEYFTYITGFAAAIPLVIGLISGVGKLGARKE